MVSLWHSQPLCSIDPARFKAVSTQLSAPLMGYATPRRKIPFEIMALLSNLDIWLEKTGKNASNDNNEQSVTDSMVNKLRVSLKHWDKNVTLEDYLVNTGLGHMFQTASAYLLTPGRLGRCESGIPEVREYLAFIASLNQTVVLARQIQRDIYHQSTHKYMAHQIALLFQSLGPLGSRMVEFKRKIESRFDQIKRVTERGTAQLNDDEKEWLNGVVSEIIDFLRQLQPSIMERVSEQLAFMRRPESHVIR